MDLEDRVTSLKIRIRQAKMRISEYENKHRTEPTVIVRENPTPEKNDLQAIKAKLLGQK